MTDIASSNTTQHRCQVCGSAIERRSRGRQRRFCSDACRMQSVRGRTAGTFGSRNTHLGSDTGVGISEHFSATNSISSEGVNDDLQKPIGSSLYWIEVNSVTHKLTDGAMWRTPASPGQWGGFNTERGVAWVINTGCPFGKTAWYARFKDQSYGPSNLETAKQAAMAFAKGAKSFPKRDIARAFTGPVNLFADPQVDAELQKYEAESEAEDWTDWPGEQGSARAAGKSLENSCAIAAPRYRYRYRLH